MLCPFLGGEFKWELGELIALFDCFCGIEGRKLKTALCSKPYWDTRTSEYAAPVSWDPTPTTTQLRHSKSRFYFSLSPPHPKSLSLDNRDKMPNMKHEGMQLYETWSFVRLHDWPIARHEAQIRGSNHPILPKTDKVFRIARRAEKTKGRF